MRSRLIVVFLVPMIVVLLMLGAAYASSVARGVQQQFYSQQLADAGYFVSSARVALASGNPTVVEAEMRRHSELYGTGILVVGRSGEPWASTGFDPTGVDDDTVAQIQLALSGHRGDVPPSALPWSFEDAVVVEPIFDDNDVIGAVVMVASTSEPRAEILRQWAMLAVVSLVAIAAGAVVVFRLANWVLQPLRRVNRAMAEIESGHMEARIADDTGPPELRRMIEVFNQMAGEVERTVHRQQEFALNASHELRNPLNALLLRVEYLATGLGSEWDADVEETREEGRRITQTLDTMLSLAKRGNSDVDLARVNIASLVRERVRAWRDAAGGLSITFDLRGVKATYAVTDKTTVESALDAVIDNAVKFSPQRSKIKIVTEPSGEGGRIKVTDQGPGLTDEEMESALERFWRSPKSQNVPGSGLGLAIANDLLESVGGRLRLTAAATGGLTVVLELSEGRSR
ncbi:MAG TPA: HAMP domain-containing histidine kinase [Candidatus Agrococcus pullicola]|uniref:histidine kinase n=1 Tax=Candidatus Agrococcus pullicola TaxID=2838429 RepID=A0A9D1YS84_9MICO|nr:HAMP domain-containing histidine kinase [Candidatus Agrococcus pullicola]